MTERYVHVDDFVGFVRNSAATRVNRFGTLESVPSNQARHTYHPDTGEAMGRMAEPGSTNLFTRSEEFEDAAWTKTRVTVTADQVVAPDGNTTADRVADTANTNTYFISRNHATTIGNVYTFSVFMQFTASPRNFVMSAGSDKINVNEFGVIISSNTNAAIENYGSWYRVRITFTATSTSTNFRFALADGTAETYTSGGGRGVYLWGAQLEDGYITSYIPTAGAQVTRAAEYSDILDITDFFNHNAFTVFVEYSWLSDHANYYNGEPRTVIGFSDTEPEELSNALIISNRTEDGDGFGAANSILSNTNVGEQVDTIDLLIDDPVAVPNNTLIRAAVTMDFGMLSYAADGVLLVDREEVTAPQLQELYLGNFIAGFRNSGGVVIKLLKIKKEPTPADQLAGFTA